MKKGRIPPGQEQETKETISNGKIVFKGNKNIGKCLECENAYMKLRFKKVAQYCSMYSELCIDAIRVCVVGK